MKKKIIRIIVMLIVCVFCVGNYSKLSKAESNSNKYVYFGKYPQNLVRNQDLKDELYKKESNKGMIVYNGTRYAVKYINVPFESKRYSGSYYFQEEPIKWRVLKEDNESYWLMSERIIEKKQLSDGHIEKWSDATIRTWLNDDFIDIAFPEEEKDLISTSISSRTVNWDDINLSGSTSAKGTETTKDKVWLLDQEEVMDSTFGFTDDVSRMAYATDYVDLDNTYQKWHLRGNPYYFYGQLYMTTMNADGSVHIQDTVFDAANNPVGEYGMTKANY